MEKMLNSIEMNISEDGYENGGLVSVTVLVLAFESFGSAASMLLQA